MHSDFQSAWVVIDNIVYDITEYIHIHPGGEVILESIGADGTENFSILKR